jgi:hypothetical protein
MPTAMLHDDGCRLIANLTSSSKLGAGRVGSVRLVAMPDGTSAALKQHRPNTSMGDFHREVRTQAMAGALAPLVLATCRPRYEILSELLPAPWIQELRPCQSSPHAPSSAAPMPFCTEFVALLDAMDAIGLQQDDFKPEHLRRTSNGVLKMIDFSSVHERAASTTKEFGHFAKHVNTSNKCWALQIALHRSATQALLTRRQHHGSDPVALRGADPIEFLWATSATDEDRCVAHCFAALSTGHCRVSQLNFTKYVERMPARWRAKDARAHGRA